MKSAACVSKSLLACAKRAEVLHGLRGLSSVEVKLDAALRFSSDFDVKVDGVSDRSICCDGSDSMRDLGSTWHGGKAIRGARTVHGAVTHSIDTGAAR